MVDGEVVSDEASRYVLRFVQGGERFRPVLYRDGKRVTRPWMLTFTIEDPGCADEESANTA
jgi:hypothetical protein